MKRAFGSVTTMLSVVLLFFTGGCGEPQTKADGVLRITAGLPPVAHIAGEIAGSRARVSVMLPEGKSPHDYAPGPQDVRRASASRIFFSTGLPFEQRVVKPLTAVRVVDVAKNTDKIPFGGDHKHGPDCIHDHYDHAGHHHEAMDPHVWLDLGNVLKIASCIKEELILADPAGKELFEKNFNRFKAELEKADRIIREKLAPFRGREFFVYHAAFGYYAHRYNLKQTAIELGGREIAPARLAEVIRKARAAKAKIIFVQPQFNPASSKALADAIGGNVAPLDPLKADTVKNLLQMTDDICSGFGGSVK